MHSGQDGHTLLPLIVIATLAIFEFLYAEEGRVCFLSVLHYHTMQHEQQTKKRFG